MTDAKGKRHEGSLTGCELRTNGISVSSPYPVFNLRTRNRFLIVVLSVNAVRKEEKQFESSKVQP